MVRLPDIARLPVTPTFPFAAAACVRFPVPVSVSPPPDTVIPPVAVAFQLMFPATLIPPLATVTLPAPAPPQPRPPVIPRTPVPVIPIPPDPLIATPPEVTVMFPPTELTAPLEPSVSAPLVTTTLPVPNAARFPVPATFTVPASSVTSVFTVSVPVPMFTVPISGVAVPAAVSVVAPFVVTLPVSPVFPMLIVPPAPTIVIADVPAVCAPVLVNARFPLIPTVAVPRLLAAVPVIPRSVTPVTVFDPSARLPALAFITPVRASVPAPQEQPAPPVTLRLVSVELLFPACVKLPEPTPIAPTVNADVPTLTVVPDTVNTMPTALRVPARFSTPPFSAGAAVSVSVSTPFTVNVPSVMVSVVTERLPVVCTTVPAVLFTVTGPKLFPPVVNACALPWSKSTTSPFAVTVDPAVNVTLFWNSQFGSAPTLPTTIPPVKSAAPTTRKPPVPTFTVPPDVSVPENVTSPTPVIVPAFVIAPV